MNKKIQYENKPLSNDYCSSDYMLRTPTDGVYDPCWAVRIRRETAIFCTDEQITKSRIQVVCGHKYRINSVFMHAADRTLDDNVKYLIGNELDNVS